MGSDDPTVPEFASWRSYQQFERLVKHGRRYVWGKEIRSFLDTVLATSKNRERRIAEGTVLYRAQEGVLHEPIVDQDGHDIGEVEPFGFDGERMKPRANRATEGRANPPGIPVLYLATRDQTAISEVRPWIGSEISLAHFVIRRDLRALDLSLGHGQPAFAHMTFAQLAGEEAVDAVTKEKAVWIDIDNAFSRPVTRSDDTADYVPTQILAELFAEARYDAIFYRSQFGREGHNIAVFNVEDADIVSCEPFHVTAVDIKAEPIGNRWFAKQR